MIRAGGYQLIVDRRGVEVGMKLPEAEIGIVVPKPGVRLSAATCIYVLQMVNCRVRQTAVFLPNAV